MDPVRVTKQAGFKVNLIWIPILPIQMLKWDR